jgi:hypothetical protein
MRTQLAEFESRYAFLSRRLPSMHMFSVSTGIETVFITRSPVATLTTNTISIQFITFTPGVPATERLLRECGNSSADCSESSPFMRTARTIYEHIDKTQNVLPRNSQ